jgi:hypothetical protein
MAVLHAPQYQRDHEDALAQDWAHLPVPRDWAAFGKLADAGNRLAVLLDPVQDAESVAAAILGLERLRKLGVPRREGGGPIPERDLVVTAGYYGAGKGDYRPRAFAEAEAALAQWGVGTGDLYINADICFGNVPQAVWEFDLGGYPVLKKWLGGRQGSRRDGRPLTLAEVAHFRSMIQRLAALLALHPELDSLYEAAAADSFAASEFGL